VHQSIAGISRVGDFAAIIPSTFSLDIAGALKMCGNPVTVIETGSVLSCLAWPLSTLSREKW
jgi:hypothetical protein